MNRRELLSRLPAGIGIAALSHLFGAETKKGIPGLDGLPHFAPKAKRVILLHQSGGPSQLDLFDYKPQLRKFQGVDLPASIRMGQRITGMTSGQATFPVAASNFNFQQRGANGTWVSDLIPHTAKIIDELAVIKSMHTEAINHDPAITFFQSGSQQPGRPSMGAWVSYGLGSENENLPAFVVMVSQAHAINTDQPLFSRLWGSGFLPSNYQGVKFRAAADPVLFLSDPEGISKQNRRSMLDSIGKLNTLKFQTQGDPEIETRISQYEMAYRMQTSVPELVDLSKEPESVFEMYGPESRKPGSYARNCLLARRLAERGVRFIQLYHQDWDHHGGLPNALPKLCKETDQPAAALVKDLKQRGLLDDTLVVWGGEFGRTNYCQGKIQANFGRDHHPRCFSAWMAGGGIKAGSVYGETDEFGYNVARDGLHIHDFHATLMHLLGIDHERLTYKFQGRRYRLTDVHGHVVKGLLA